MKIATISPESFENTGQQTVEKNIVDFLEEDSQITLVKVNPFVTTKDFPFSETIDNILRNYVVGNRIPRDVDKVIVPSQTRLTFDPAKVNSEIIIYVHDVFPATHFYESEKEYSWSYRNIFSYISYRFFVRYMKNLMKVDQILVPTQYVKEDIETHTPFKGKIKVVGQGIDDMPDSENIKEKAKKYDLLYVGSLLGRKNPQFLKDTLCLAEEGGLSIATVNHSKVNLPGDTYTNISDEELAELYKSSKYYIHPSYVEGFGRTPLEAQKYGCVPIALNNPINHEVLGEEGQSWLSVDSSQEVLEIIRNGESKQSVISAKKNADRFEWQSVEINLKRIIKE